MGCHPAVRAEHHHLPGGRRRVDGTVALRAEPNPLFPQLFDECDEVRHGSAEPRVADDAPFALLSYCLLRRHGDDTHGTGPVD